MKQALLGASCLMLLGIIPTSRVMAEDVADDTTVVVVTAQKRAQRLIDVPLGMSVLGGEELAKRNIQTVNDLAFAVPGLSLRYDGPGSSQIFMRGAANIRGSDALVASYMDEVPVTFTGGYRQIDLRALDVERIEVLKGPQGTLYGQGAMAGTVRYVTVSPKLDTLEGFVRADVSTIEDGDTNSKVSGAVTVPIIEGKMALRLAGAIEDGGGWIDQPALGIKDGNNQDIYNFRAKLFYKPTDDFDLLATFGLYSMKSKFGLDYENEDHVRPTPVSDDYGLLPPRHDQSWVYNLTANYDLGFAKLTSSTSYMKLHRDYTLTYIAGPGTVYDFQNEGFDGNHDRAEQFTQELRLSSVGTGPLQYTVGAFYRDAEGNLDDEGISYFFGGTYPFTYRKYDTSKSISVFGDVSYRFTDKLTVGAGIRTFRDKASAWYGTYNPDGSENILKDTFKSTDPRVYLTYALNPKWNLYGNIAKGFRSGGFNGIGLETYDPEKLTNYEIGTKGVAFDGRLKFDLATYFSKYEDALKTGQFFNYDPDSDSGGGFISITRNVGEVEIKGVEGSLNWWATPELQLSGTFAYTDSEVSKLNIDASEGEDVGVQVGDPGDYVPKWSYTLGADYSFEWAGSVPGFVHVDYVWRDKVYVTDGSVLSPRTQSSQTVGLLNGHIGASWGPLTAELYANNITNENRILDPYHVWQQSSRSKPRTIGVTLSRTF